MSYLYLFKVDDKRSEHFELLIFIYLAFCRSPRGEEEEERYMHSELRCEDLWRPISVVIVIVYFTITSFSITRILFANGIEV
tara:strand:+ start:1305 stop:1550 length:246 start_codon:yes stop_codon:yes gene_type:complete